MGVNDDAAYPDVEGSGRAAGNAVNVHPWTAQLGALRQHIDTRLDQKVDSMGQTQGVLQDALLPLGVQQGAPLGGNAKAAS